MKNPLSLRLFLAFLGASAFAGSAFASTNGSDNASNYGGTWANGSNGGTGFGSWAFANSASNSGEFIGDSTFIGGSMNSATGVNSSGVAFGMFGNNGSGAANATRSFAGGSLAVGQKFALDIAVNYRNGGKGVDLRVGNTSVFTFNTAGDDYKVSNAATGNGSIANTTANTNQYDANTDFHLIFSQTSTTGGTWEIQRTGGVTDDDTGTYTGDASGFNLFVYNTENSNVPQSNFYANNFALTGVPEPSTWLAGGLIFGAAGCAVRRRLRLAA